MGGGTVFPNQGIAVFPKKGSLLFWHNLNTQGNQAEESLHGACPTLFGIKWGNKSAEQFSQKIFASVFSVSNKWIREGSQVFKRPCETS